MKKVYVIVKLVKYYSNENWRFAENDVPGSLKVFTTFRHAALCVSELAENLKLQGWSEHNYGQGENVRERRDFYFKGKLIALLIIEKDLIV